MREPCCVAIWKWLNRKTGVNGPSSSSKIRSGNQNQDGPVKGAITQTLMEALAVTPSESALEKELTAYATEVLKVLSIKLNLKGRRGWPDRMYMCNGRVC